VPGPTRRATSGLWQDQTGRASWYIQWDVSGTTVVFTVHLITYFVLWTYLIPLSLFVSIELCRLAQLLRMNADSRMAGPAEPGVAEAAAAAAAAKVLATAKASGRGGADAEAAAAAAAEAARMAARVPMACRNSNITEDLGRVDHIFSDKTGTLTQNAMRLRAWALPPLPGAAKGGNSTIYTETVTDDAAGAQASADLAVSAASLQAGTGVLARTLRQLADGVATAPPGTADRLRFVLRSVALCNTVVPAWEELPGRGRRLTYEADSPDELALLEALRDNGVELRARTDDSVSIALHRRTVGLPPAAAYGAGDDAAWLEERWRIVQTLEFSSDRKRMSVLVQQEQVGAGGKAGGGGGAGEAGPIYLFTKGADSVMLPLMAASEGNVRSTQQARTRQRSAPWAQI
jgi:magnesium-transporting ATPase (P-type)